MRITGDMAQGSTSRHVGLRDARNRAGLSAFDMPARHGVPGAMSLGAYSHARSGDRLCGWVGTRHRVPAQPVGRVSCRAAAPRSRCIARLTGAERAGRVRFGGALLPVHVGPAVWIGGGVAIGADAAMAQGPVRFRLYDGRVRGAVCAEPVEDRGRRLAGSAGFVAAFHRHASAWRALPEGRASQECLEAGDG